eukprot:gene17375-19114_t
MEDKGIVEYFGLGDGHRCGYCGQTDTNISHGMWAHKLTCANYEDLLNRGWRRSGKYVYKPLMDQLCCPMYTIRCDATKFKMSKSQRKVLKKMRKYLIDGKEPKSSAEEGFKEPATKATSQGKKQNMATRDGPIKKDVKPEESQPKVEQAVMEQKFKPRKKAKEIRKENKLKKLAERKAKGELTESMEFCNPKKKENPEKTLEELIEIPNNIELAHKLEIKTIDVQDDEFSQYFQTSFELFCKYQQAIHKDPKEKLNERRVKTVQSCPRSKEFSDTFELEFMLFKEYQVNIHNEDEDENDVDQFKRFLVDCPLVVEEAKQGLPSTGLGAFHQQYYLDGKLIAVGVIDILPHCLSSKYLFYDPTCSFLSLGTYSALREIYFIRKLQQGCPEFIHYYLGFYIHSCQKMRYKGQYEPSYLLCPEAYTFQPIKSCIEKLEVNRYARFDPTPQTASDDEDLDSVLVMCNYRAMSSSTYMELFVTDDKKAAEMRTLKEYAKLAGKATKDMFIFRSGS